MTSIALFLLGCFGYERARVTVSVDLPRDRARLEQRFESVHRPEECADAETCRTELRALACGLARSDEDDVTASVVVRDDAHLDLVAVWAGTVQRLVAIEGVPDATISVRLTRRPRPRQGFAYAIDAADLATLRTTVVRGQWDVVPMDARTVYVLRGPRGEVTLEGASESPAPPESLTWAGTVAGLLPSLADRPVGCTSAEDRAQRAAAASDAK